MLTQDDILKMKQVFATKQDLEQLREELATKEQFNQVMNGVDKMIGELKSFREAVPAIAHALKR